MRRLSLNIYYVILLLHFRSSIHNLCFSKNTFENYIEEKYIIPVFYGIDNNFTLPTIVSITSICETSKENTFNQIFVMVPEDFKEKNIIKIKRIEEKYKFFCNITFINMGKEYKNTFQRSKHKRFTTPTYYRISIPELFQNMSKIIYLDGDTIILKDLQNFYNLDMKGNYILGSIDKKGENMRAYNLKTDKYVNAGVLLMNLTELRKINFTQKCKEFLTKFPNCKYNDQSALNYVLYNHIGFLPPNIGLTPTISGYRDMIDWLVYKRGSYAKIVCTIDEFIKGYSDPYIIHYLTIIKPWKLEYKEQFLNYFLYYSQKTEIYQELMKQIYVQSNNIHKKKQKKRTNRKVDLMNKKMKNISHPIIDQDFIYQK